MQPRSSLPGDHNTAVAVTEAVTCKARGIATEPRRAHIEVSGTRCTGILVDAMREPDKIAGLGEA